ncbi:hypothetical protein [Clostridium sp. UBA1056]|uniref:hypothetical protein n=1 Tax=unclassified Clostridium TaxID=2614128 RepID=UPI0032161F01
MGAPSISLTLEKQQDAEIKYSNRLLERIIDRNNLNQALKRVKSNKGSHGIDGMKVDEFLQYLKENGDSLRQSILDGSYKPNPVRRVEIPKLDGKKHPLGIPRVVDRVINNLLHRYLVQYLKRVSLKMVMDLDPTEVHIKQFLNVKNTWIMDMVGSRYRFREIF